MKKWRMGLVLLGVISVSFSGPLVKLGLQAGASPVSIAFLRMAISCALLLPFAIRSGALRQVLRGTPRQLGLMVLAGLFLALHYTAWMTSLARTSTFASVALVCMQPLFVAALSSLVLHEKVPRGAVPGAVISIAGALCIGLLSMTGEGGGDPVGDLMALSGAALMAGHWLCGRVARRTAPALGYIPCVYGICAIFLLLWMPATGGFAAPVASLPYILLLAVGCTLGGHALFTIALDTVSADVVSFALLGEPVGAAIWAWILFGEAITWPLMLGGALILLGLALYLRATSRAAAPVKG